MPYRVSDLVITLPEELQRLATIQRTCWRTCLWFCSCRYSPCTNAKTLPCGFLPTRIPDCPANSKTPLAHETITPVVQFTPELDIESIDTLKEQLYAALQAVELREAELAKEVSAANLQEITQLEEKLGKALKQVTAEKEKLLKKK